MEKQGLFGQTPAAGFFSHADDRESCAMQKRSARSSMSFPAMSWTKSLFYTRQWRSLPRVAARESWHDPAQCTASSVQIFVWITTTVQIPVGSTGTQHTDPGTSKPEQTLPRIKSRPTFLLLGADGVHCHMWDFLVQKEFTRYVFQPNFLWGYYRGHGFSREMKFWNASSMLCSKIKCRRKCIHRSFLSIHVYKCVYCSCSNGC